MNTNTNLVLIPGMMCDERLFASQIHNLNEIGGVKTLVSPISKYDTIQQLASEILQSSPRKFSLAGLSMGGIVAMEIWRQAPQRIEKLCFMDTNPMAETDAIKIKRQPQIEKAKAGKLKEILRDEMKPNYLSVTLNQQHRQEILDLCMDMALGLGKEVFIRQSNALKNRPDQTQMLKDVECPTLILHGEEDQLCPIDRHQLLQQLIPHANYASIPKAGHLPTLENPQEVNKHLMNWITA